MNGECHQSEVCYNATIDSITPEGMAVRQTYTGVTKNSFKVRYRGHKTSINRPEYSKSTELSEYIWDIKNMKHNFNIRWKILGKAKPYSPGSKECNLCNLEKYHIVKSPDLTTLNKRDEILTICRHRKAALLCNYKG